MTLMKTISEKSNNKILLQYSGGKDSTACLLKLISDKSDVEVIHFTHKYAYSIPTNEVLRLCKEFNIVAHVIDITLEIESKLTNTIKDRPCRYCKSIMDQITVDFAVRNRFNYICVGDTGSDTTLVQRIKNNGDEDLILSKYFNKNVNLPPNIYIYRPLIYDNNKKVLEFIESEGVTLTRVGDTGDRYFEYSREGCPLQFKDFGEIYTKSLMNKLKNYNTLCTQFARERNIQASMHLPSEFIVTIPKGYEQECRAYLIANGCTLTELSKELETTHTLDFSIKVHSNLLDPNTIKIVLYRLYERLEEEIIEFNQFEKYIFIFSENTQFSCIISNNRYFHSKITSSQIIDVNKLENLIVEIFHTYSYAISIKSINL